jgi:hypothetical protein
MTAIFASPVVAAVALVLGAVAPAAAQQTNQDYSTVPSYSARPAGMCWHRGVGYDLNGLNGYWSACTNTSANQSANNARAQAQPSQREHTGRRR